MYQYVTVRRTQAQGAGPAGSAPPGSGPAGAPPPPKPDDTWEDKGQAVSFPDGPAFTPDGRVVIDPETALPFGEPTIHDGPVWTWSWEEGAEHGCLHNKLTFWSCWVRREDGHYEILPHQTPRPTLGDGEGGANAELGEVTVGIFYQPVGAPSPVEFGTFAEDGAVFMGSRRYGPGAPIQEGTDVWQVVRAAGPRRVVKYYKRGRLAEQYYFADTWRGRGWYNLYANITLGGVPVWTRLLWALASPRVRWTCLALLMLAVFGVPITPLIVYPTALSWLAFFVGPRRPDHPFWPVDAEVP